MSVARGATAATVSWSARRVYTGSTASKCVSVSTALLVIQARESATAPRASWVPPAPSHVPQVSSALDVARGVSVESTSAVRTPASASVRRASLDLTVHCRVHRGSTVRDASRSVSATTAARVTPPRATVPVREAGWVPSARIKTCLSSPLLAITWAARISLWRTAECHQEPARRRVRIGCWVPQGNKRYGLSTTTWENKARSHQIPHGGTRYALHGDKGHHQQHVTTWIK